jgi:hypothetical protein
MRRMMKTAVLAAGLIVASQAASQEAAATAEPDRDWRKAALADLHAFHAIIEANHPGPVNPLDPHFKVSEARALALAERRAQRVRDYPGYLWTLRGYATSFDDGHVQIGFDKGPTVVVRWPGFLTGFDGRGHQRVMTRSEDAPVPDGATLIDCDGIAADRLAEQHVGAFRGRWQLSSQRIAAGGRLFLDMGNPFVARPSLCHFRIGSTARVVPLAWRILPDAELDSRLAAMAPRVTPAIGARTLADGTRWFSLSDFNGDPDGAAAKALVPLIAAMARDRDAIASAPAIVLDVRGNGGGSSDWSQQIARVVWGRAAVGALPRIEQGVDWRVSPANLATLEGYRRTFAAPGASQEARDWAKRAAGGIAEALKAGRTFWREADEETPASQPAAAAPSPRGPVYVLTDWRCASACLDAVDLWKSLGAVQIGQETSADTLYMDLREDGLPSGLASVWIPMKVYRGRQRGSNVPQVPTYRYAGDPRDEGALESWVASLPRNTPGASQHSAR